MIRVGTISLSLLCYIANLGTAYRERGVLGNATVSQASFTFEWNASTSPRRLLEVGGELPLPTEKPHPFLLLFTTSVGSSWLLQELAVNPTVCVIGHEPLDDYCEGGKSSGNGKRQVGWLRVALNPPNLDVYSEHMGRRMARGEAWRAAWRQWKAKLIQHSLPCRVEEIHSSIEGEKCDASFVRSYGFKTRLFAGGMMSDRKSSKWERLKDEVHNSRTRIVRLKRTNRLEQALSVYWKKRPVELGKNGKLVRGPSKRPADAQRPVEDRNRLDEILATISQREKLLDAAVKFVGAPTLTLTYEELTSEHRRTIQKLGNFLGVKLSEHALEAIPEAERWVKQGPRGVCQSVENYADFCVHYSKTIYAEHLPDPCTPGIWDCCKCRPQPRMIFPTGL